MTYKHRVSISEVATSILPPLLADSAVPVVIGTGPGTGTANPNEPVICYSYAEAIAKIGDIDGLDWGDYTLAEAIYSQFVLYQTAPIILIDVYDATIHTVGVSDVDEADIIAALPKVDECYTRFGIVPGSIICPGWSHTSTMAAAMAAKANSINTDLFSCVAVVDIDSDTVLTYSAANTAKTTNSLTDPNQLVCWPKIKLGTKEFWMSTQMAGLMGRIDADKGDNVPYFSPSNQNLKMDSAVANGVEVWLGLDQAELLNGQGIITALNGPRGWVAFGNRTGAYPGSTDVKDTMLPVRRMFNWIGNTLVLTWFQKIDYPINRRLIETIVDSINIWFNGLAAKGAILGGRVEFIETENTSVDLMDGKITFHCFVTPPSPAREISFVLEYDPAYLATLFG